MKQKLYPFVYKVQLLVLALCLSAALLPTQVIAQTALTVGGGFNRIEATGSYQDFVIPNSLVGTYEIKFKLRGGDGGGAETPGYECRANGGDGAYVTAIFNIGTGTNELRPGGKIRFIPGKGGGSYQDNIDGYGSGGGGSAVLYTHSSNPDTDLPSRYMSNAGSKWVILAIAGGGGGAYRLEFAFCGVAANGQGGRAAEDGGNGNGIYGGDGGTEGGGGKSATFTDDVGGQGGAGAFGNGGSDASNTYYTSYPGVVGKGPFSNSSNSFGFAGGGNTNGGGGGGGGYSGGGGGGIYEEGGGGGSFVNAAAVESSKQNGGASNYNADDGYVEYQILQFGAPVAICEGLLVISLPYDDTEITLSASDVDNGSYDLGDGTITSMTIDKTDCTTLSLGGQTVTLTITDDDGNTSTCDAYVLFNPDNSGVLAMNADATNPITVGYSGSYVDYEIPPSGNNRRICFTLNGGDGGYAAVGANAGNACTDCKSRGGYGALTTVCFDIGCDADELHPSSILRMIAGGKGSSQDAAEFLCTGAGNGGGGGGTALLYKEYGCTDWEILAVAGGGGGAYQGQFSGACVDSEAGGNAGTNVSGNGNNGNGDTNVGQGGSGGEGGYDDGGSLANAGGGGGYLSAGADIQCLLGGTASGGAGGSAGGAGGSGGCNTRNGGYGFGGGGAGLDSGGGGGGYSGGGPGGTTGRGGGGGSYVNLTYGINWSITTQSYSGNPANGYITYNFTGGSAYGVEAQTTANCIPSLTVELGETGTARIFATDLDNGSFTNCGGGVFPIFPPFNADRTFYCSNLGTQTVTVIMAEIPFGLGQGTTTCTTTVTVVDNLVPEAVCQDITINLGTSGSITLSDDVFDGGSTDNCGIAEYDASQTTFDCDDIGTKQVGLVVKDAAGNLAYCLSTVVVMESGTVAPVAKCKNATLELDETGEATLFYFDIDNNSTDNCGIVDYALSQFLFTCDDVGPNNVTMTVEDGNGLTNSCTATVTVQDPIAPTVTCKNLTVQLDENGEYTLTNTELEVSSSDNCGMGGSAFVTPAVLTCDDAGQTISVQVSHTDVGGNTNSCTSMVTVQDNTAPTAVCQNITATLDADGQVTVSGSEVNSGSYDNCQIDHLVLDLGTPPAPGSATSQTFDCDDTGQNTVTLGVIDATGNLASCTAIVTVQDVTPPTALCQNLTTYLNESGVSNFTDQDVDAGSYDNCGFISSTLNPSAFDCSDVGEQTVTLTVTDASNNISTCTSLVTIVDNIPPIVECQPTYELVLDENGTAILPTLELFASIEESCLPFTATLDRSTFTCEDLFSPVTVTFTAYDASGNPGSCTTQVTVLDETAPTAICQNLTVQLDDNGQGSITAHEIDNGSSDVCGDVYLELSTNTFTCNDIGHNTVTLTIMDSSENSSTCTATVTVEDNVAPVALCQNLTVQLDANGLSSISTSDVDHGSNDACGIASLALSQTQFNCSHVGPNTVTLTVVDNNENSSTCSATVNVQDNINPVAICQNVTIQLHANGQGSITTADVDNGSNDACGIASLALSQTQFDCSHVGDNPVTLMVTDVNGNSSNCSSIITVHDNVAPVAVCRNTTIQLDNVGQTTLPVTLIDNGSNDACGIANLTVAPNTFDCVNVGDNPVVLTVTDHNGNITTCSATATVQDNIAPTISQCEGLFAVFNGEQEITAASVIDFSATDACGLLSTTYSPSLITCDQLGQNVDVLVTVIDVNGNSSECLAVVKTDGLPCGFVDFGDDGIACEGSSNVEYDASTETFTLESNGCSSNNFAQDNAAYTYTELCGDGEIIAHVTNISPLGQGWAGITMRESEAPGAKKVELMANLGNFIRRSIRWANNSPANPAQMFRPQAYWLKIVRNGNLFLGYASTDGVTWQNVLMASVSMNNCIQAGLLVTNYSSNTVITGSFDNVEVNPASSGMNLQMPDTNQEHADQSVELDFNLSPNPATDRLFLEIIGQQGQRAEVEILNQLGQRVLRRTTEEAGNRNEELDLHMLESGTYFLRVRTDQAEMVKKFLIVK